MFWYRALALLKIALQSIHLTDVQNSSLPRLYSTQKRVLVPDLVQATPGGAPPVCLFGHWSHGSALASQIDHRILARSMLLQIQVGSDTF
jgi:hypothetical protein